MEGIESYEYFQSELQCVILFFEMFSNAEDFNYKDGRLNNKINREIKIFSQNEEYESFEYNSKFFEKIYNNHFLSTFYSDIVYSLKIFKKYAKNDYFKYFNDFNFVNFNVEMIDLAQSKEFDLIQEILRFYDIFLSKCDETVCKKILDFNLCSFFQRIYHSPPNLLCKSYIFSILSNVLLYNKNELDTYIQSKNYLYLIDTFHSLFENVSESDDDAMAAASVLKLLYPLFLNYSMILNQNYYNFFNKCINLFKEAFQVENRFTLPTSIKIMEKCTSTGDDYLVRLFYVNNLFLLYFQLCSHKLKKIRINMLKTILNFKNLQNSELLRIIDAGLFDVEFQFLENDDDEMILVLKICKEYVLKSNIIAKKLIDSKLLQKYSNIQPSTNFKVNQEYVILLSSLIMTNDIELISKTFELCPNYIELCTDFLDSSSDDYIVIILRAFIILAYILHNATESELYTNISYYLNNDFFLCKIEELILEKENGSITSDVAKSLLSFLKDK